MINRSIYKMAYTTTAQYQVVTEWHVSQPGQCRTSGQQDSPQPEKGAIG